MKDYIYGTRAPESILKSWLRGMMLAATTLLFISALLLVASFPTDAMADDEDEIEEVVVTGVRGKPTTVQDSPVPIDVFSEDAIDGVAFTDMNDIMRTLVPSYGVRRQPISDGATFIRPATMRGLPTDKTLVLVNSKRRHRAALVSIGGSGTQGPDLATIPGVAVKSIEVLRDGASALYGSDAIAGVMNFILKDNSEGGSISFDSGKFSENDGESYSLSANVGMPLMSDGFLSLSFEVSESEPTYRGEQYCGSWFCLDPEGAEYATFIAEGNPARVAYATDPAFIEATKSASIDGGGPNAVVQPWGSPESEAKRFFFNAGIPLEGGMEAYAFGNYSDSVSDSSFFYRSPYNGTIEELREPDGSIYFPLEKYPGGFTPRFFGNVSDIGLVMGMRSVEFDRFGYDISARYGESKIEYTLANTINPSMGPQSPQVFRPGDLINEETQIQVDFTYEVSDRAGLAFGASYLSEEYEVVEGEPTSYFAGPYANPDPWQFCNDDGTATASGLFAIAGGSTLDCANSDDPVYTVVGVGSNGFPGYSPAFSEIYMRTSFAVYGEMDIDITDSLFAQVAVRFEDYEDFGSETVYKVAAKYDFTDTFGLRASFNTGFRAPTPGQQGTTNVSTRLPNGFPVATGLFPASGPVAKALGAQPLRPETSENFSIGITGTIGDKLDFTLDYYSIDVEDYFSAISTLDVSTDADSGAAYDNYLKLNNAGVVGANSIGGVFYFTNAYDLGVSGWDLVATYPFEGDKSSTSLTARVGYSELEFDSDPSAYINEEGRYDTVNFDPNMRAILTSVTSWEDFSLMLRASYWGSASNFQSGNIQDYGSMIMVDMEASYLFEEVLVSGGIRNMFDQYPDEDELSDFCCGRVYPSGAGASWNGAYYYFRVSKEF